MKFGAYAVEGEKILSLIDALKDEFSARKYLSKSGSFQVLVLEKFYFRSNSDLAAFIVFDLEDNSHCRVDIVVAGGASGWAGFDFGAEASMLGKIRDFIERHEDQNGLRVKSIDSKFETSYGPTPEQYLKKCVKCGERIPIASEECQYCGAHQPYRKSL